MDKGLLKVFVVALFISGIPLALSGLPQPSDIIMLCLGLYFIAHNTEDIFRNNFLLIAFTFYTMMINMIYCILLSDTSFLPPLFYYPFCFIIYILGRNIKFYANAIKYLRICFIILGTLLVGINLFFPSLSERQDLLFNNPNQMGYWALSMIIIYLYLLRNIKGKNFHIIDLIIVFLFSYFIIASLSKAAVGSLFVFLLIFTLQNFNIKKLILPLGITIVALIGFSNTNVFKNLETRMEQASKEKDSSLKSRGYNRIWDSPEYLYFGAGQGGYTRFFKADEHIIEIHSSIGTVLFSYGIVGLILFCLMLLLMVNRVDFIVYLAPLFLYSLTHEGLRETNFWLLLGFFSNKSIKDFSLSNPINI